MPSPAPSVTAILLSYNCREFIAAAVRSVLDQDYGDPIEIIVSDDASTDGTFTVLHEALMGYRGPHRIALSQWSVNSGSKSNHLNRIFPKASGEILISFDGDDISERSRVRKIVDTFRADPSVHAVYSSFSTMDKLGRPCRGGRVPHPPDHADTRTWFARVDAYAAGATLAIRKDVAEKFGPLEPDINEDIVLPFRAGLLGRVAFIPEPLVRARRHTESFTADMGRFASRESYRSRMQLGIQRAKRNVYSRLADIHAATAMMPKRAGEMDALKAIVYDSLSKAEMTEQLISPSITGRLLAIVRLMRLGAYRDALRQHAFLALAPGLYLRYKRRRFKDVHERLP